MTKKPDKERKITFYAKEPIRCPVCDASFHREELFSGRVSADDLTDELHRTYKPLQAYGEVYPLCYEVDVCPACFYAAYRPDFLPMAIKSGGFLRDRIQYRVEEVQRIFAGLDYQESRRLIEGAASYYLAILSYEHGTKEFSPTIKSAISAVRAAWLCNDLHRKNSNENWDYVAGLFYRKARYYYRVAIEVEQNGKEPYSSVRNLGPDTDKNYSHEGVLYMAAILELKYGPQNDHEGRRSRLAAAKIAVARMFGFGKKTKAKPGPLLENARDLYNRLKAELQDNDDDEE
ncbi:MAG: DUF2225 domain-containing protein [Spirochaetales bacterium]|nr:MAG: DUF2225 domain-containing protein [Spirochaetales bacterium]